METLLAHADWVRNLAHRLVSDAATADDVIQETWLAALQGPPRHDGNLRSWLGLVARNAARQERRGARRRNRRETERPAATPSPSTSEVLQRESMRRSVVEQVLALEEPYRETMLLRFYEGIPPREIARRRGESVETVRTRIKRGLRTLRTRLDGRHGDRRAWALALVPLAATAPLPAAETTATASSLTTLLGVVAMNTPLKLGLVGVVVVLGAVLVFQQMGDAPDDGGLDTGDVVAEEETGRTDVRRAAVESDTPADVETPAGTEETADPEQPAEVTDETATEPDTITVEGVVLDDNNQPVPGATVIVGTRAKNFWFDDLRSAYMTILQHVEREHPVHPTTRAGEDGRYRVEGVERDSAIYVAGFHADVGAGVKTGVVVPSAAKVIPLDIRLERGIVIHGRVTDGEGNGLAGANVYVTGIDHRGTGSIVASVHADGNGRYETAPLAFPKLRARATLKRYYDGRGVPVDAEDGVYRKKVDFTLTPAQTLEGKLVRPDGSPAVLAELVAERFGAEAVPAYLSTYRPRFFASYRPASDDPNFTALGHCRGKVTHDEATYVIALDSPRLKHVSVFLGDVRVGEAPIPEDLSAPDVVIDPADLPRPPVHKTLTLIITEEETGAPVTACDFVLENQTAGARLYTHRRESMQSDSGRYELKGTRAGQYLVTLRSKGYGVAARRIVVSEDASPAEDAITLRPAVAKLGGIVRDGAGRPLKAARVLLTDTKGESPHGGRAGFRTTDASGKFEYDELGEGDHFLSVSHVDHAPMARTVTLVTGDNSVGFRMQKGVTVRVSPQGAHGPYSFRLLDAAGRPLRDDRLEQSQSFGSGFKFRVLEAEHVLHVICPAFVTASIRFDGVEGKHLKPELIPVK